jgi:hypothetical protein
MPHGEPHQPDEMTLVYLNGPPVAGRVPIQRASGNIKHQQLLA